MKLKLLAIVLLVAVGAVAVFVSVGGLPAQGASATSYLTAVASMDDVTDEVAATGTAAPAAMYALAFGVDPQVVADTTQAVGSGTWRVTKVAAVVGQAVKKGDVLAVADTTDLDLQLKIAANALANAKVQEVITQEDLAAASGTDQIRQARVSYRNALTAVWQATKERDDLVAERSRATIVAPIDGVTTEVNVVEGSDSTGTSIVLASATFRLTAEVVQSDVTSMRVGQPASVTVGAIDANLEGTVSAIGVTPVSSSGTAGDIVSYPVTVTLNTAPAEMRSGMTADVTIVTATATNVLTVPSAALRGTAGDYRVQVVGTDGTLAVRTVTAGLVTSTTAEIQSGLAAGDVVVTGTASSQQQGTGTGPGGGFGGLGPGAGGVRVP